MDKGSKEKIYSKSVKPKEGDVQGEGSNTLELNRLIKPLLDKYNYPCFHREINKVVYGKHAKGIRKTGKTQEVNKLQRKLINKLKSGFITTEDQLFKYIIHEGERRKKTKAVDWIDWGQGVDRLMV